jgi:hypothetical protein
MIVPENKLISIFGYFKDELSKYLTILKKSFKLSPTIIIGLMTFFIVFILIRSVYLQISDAKYQIKSTADSLQKLLEIQQNLTKLTIFQNEELKKIRMALEKE